MAGLSHLFQYKTISWCSKGNSYIQFVFIASSYATKESLALSSFIVSQNTLCKKRLLKSSSLSLEVYMGPLLELVQVSLDGIVPLRCDNHISQLSGLCKLAKNSLNPTVFILDEGIKSISPNMCL